MTSVLAGLEDVGVQLIHLLAAHVLYVVLGQVVGGEDEGQAVFDLVEVGGRHHDALEGVLGGEDDVLLAAAIGGEGDVGDLLVLAVDLAGVFVEGVDLDGLAEDEASWAWANSASRAANFVMICSTVRPAGGEVSSWPKPEAPCATARCDDAAKVRAREGGGFGGADSLVWRSFFGLSGG